jgi:two-component system, LytTR family, sensor kinase
MASFKIIIIYVIWALLWIFVQSIVVIYAGYPETLSLFDAALNIGLIILFGYGMSLSMGFYNPGFKQLPYLVLGAIFLAFLIVKLHSWIFAAVIYQAKYHYTFIYETTVIRIAFAWLMISFIIVVSWMWYYLQEQKESEARKLSAEKLAKEAELYNLRQQLQPHFLFNSLNSINALIGSQPQMARKMVQQLSDFLRGTLKKDHLQNETLEDEVAQLHLYLEIEKVRFGHRLQTEIMIDEEAKKLKLPALLLQPLVENALKFGLYDTTGETKIRISAKYDNGFLLIVITNPYDPDTSNPNKGAGFGLTSVSRRLYLLFGRQDLINTGYKDSTFMTTIKIPQIQNEVYNN